MTRMAFYWRHWSRPRTAEEVGEIKKSIQVHGIDKTAFNVITHGNLKLLILPLALIAPAVLLNLSGVLDGKLNAVGDALKTVVVALFAWGIIQLLITVVSFSGNFLKCRQWLASL